MVKYIKSFFNKVELFPLKKIQQELEELEKDHQYLEEILTFFQENHYLNLGPKDPIVSLLIQDLFFNKDLNRDEKDKALKTLLLYLELLRKGNKI